MANRPISSSARDSSEYSSVRDLARRLAELVDEVAIGLMKTWAQEDGTIAFEFTSLGRIQYKGVDTNQGLVVKGSNGKMYYTTVTSGAQAGQQVLETYFGEEFRFVKGYFEGVANHKYYVAESGQYEIVTTKEGAQRTIGKIILPDGQSLEFTGDEDYVEIDDIFTKSYEDL